MTTTEKIENLMNDTAALEKMVKAATPDELAAAMQASGIVLENVTKEEAFEAFQQAKNGELAENDLDEVAGGYSLNASGSFLGKIFNLERSTTNGCPTLTAKKQVVGLAFSINLHLFHR